MRSIALYSLLAIIPHIRAEIRGYAYSPFCDPIGSTNQNQKPILEKRQSITCGLGQELCSTLGSGNLCCGSGYTCTPDNAGNVACCSTGVYCSGTLSGSTPATATTSGFILGSSSTTPTVTSPLTTAFGGGGSTVANSYYPFIYIPTNYQNRVACSSAYSNCQVQSTSCLVSLAGENGVTVSGFPGYGITVTGQTGTVLSAASSICSTLSLSACYDLNLAQCNNYANAAAKPTACPGMVYAAGAVAGAFGAMMQ